MTHNRYANRVPVLPAAFVPTPSFIRALDAGAAASVNGDDGGLWTPKTPLIIGGAGVALSTAGGITASVRTGAHAPPGALVLGASDWPTYSAPRSLEVLFPIIDRLAALLDSLVVADFDDSTPGSLKQGTHGLLAITPVDTKHFPQGATIATIEYRFRVGTRPASVPGSLPSIRITSYDSSGALLTDAQTLPVPATVDAYYNNGLPQSIVLTPVNNATVLATRVYVCVVSDPTTTGNVAHSIEITFTAADLQTNL